MDESSLITDELKKLIGVPGEPIVFKVEEGAIKRYAEAIGDPNPLYNDVEYASKSKYGRLVCPPGFTGWPVKENKMLGFVITDSLLEAGAPPRILDGGIEFEFFMPIGAGDVMVVTNIITKMSERETRLGKMLFVTAESTFLNQNGDVALKSQLTLLFS